MCGIVGYIGPRDAYRIIITGLKRQEYLGYDSTGVALINSDEKARKRKVITIISEGDKMVPIMADEVFFVPANEIIAPLLSVIPLQLLSYFIEVEKECDVAKPRNPAKSITVE